MICILSKFSGIGLHPDETRNQLAISKIFLYSPKTYNFFTIKVQVSI